MATLWLFVLHCFDSSLIIGKISISGIDSRQVGLDFRQGGLNFQQDGLDFRQRGLYFQQDGLDFKQGGLDTLKFTLSVRSKSLLVERLLLLGAPISLF